MTHADATAAVAGAAALLGAALVTDAPAVTAIRLVVLGAAVGAIIVHDLREHRIPNRIVLPATIVCAGLLLADGLDVGARAPALAVVAGLLVAALVAPAALGMGDVKLALLLAVGLDGAAAAAILGGFALAAFSGLLLLLRNGAAARRTALPLAPFLAASGLIAAALA